MNIIEELKACLALQDEIDAKTMELRRRYKAIVEEHRKTSDRTLFVEIDSETYELKREDSATKEHREAIRTARELGGFWLYRLFKRGKIVR